MLSQVLSWCLGSKGRRFFTCVEEHFRAADTSLLVSFALQSSLSDEQGKYWMCNRSTSLLTNELFFFFKCSARKLSLGFKYDLKFNLRYLIAPLPVFSVPGITWTICYIVYIFCVFLQLKKMSSCKILYLLLI